jgi:hypothetical protein
MEAPAISGRFTLWPSWIAAQRTLRQGGRGRLVEVLAAVRVVGEIIAVTPGAARAPLARLIGDPTQTVRTHAPVLAGHRKESCVFGTSDS